MSSSSEEEDLSQFASAVACAVLCSPATVTKEKLKSDRYLTVESHYNDVRVSDELQKRIGSKISKIIEKNVEFVDKEPSKVKKRKIKGGIRLFSSSAGYLSTETSKDTATELHNQNSKKIKKLKRQLNGEPDEISDKDKVESVAVSGEHIMSGEETKHWKSRRKEKLFKYKSNGKSKVLTAVGDK